MVGSKEGEGDISSCTVVVVVVVVVGLLLLVLLGRHHGLRHGVGNVGRMVCLLDGCMEDTSEGTGVVILYVGENVVGEGDDFLGGGGTGVVVVGDKVGSEGGKTGNDTSLIVGGSAGIAVVGTIVGIITVVGGSVGNFVGKGGVVMMILGALAVVGDTVVTGAFVGDDDIVVPTTVGVVVVGNGVLSTNSKEGGKAGNEICGSSSTVGVSVV
mmetsp:Transcript_22152/g.29153  ORF Transcript_22152/g.29153 Transcript_22152/m.29153 type:complete len:212 (-) Transcript_22152:530-1165(-)